MRKLIFVEAGVLCAALLLALAGCKAPDGAERTRAASAALQKEAAKPSATADAKQQPAQKPAPADGVRRMTPAESFEAVRKGEAVIVDVRDANSFKTGHIKGSINIPRNEINNKLGELPKDKLLIFYCA